MMVREETRALMLRWGRSMSSRAAPLAGAAARPSAPPAEATAASPAATQQRFHLNATTATSTQTSLPPSLLLSARGPLAPVLEESAASARPHSIVRCESVNQGKQVVVEFSDGTRYEIHGAWLKDSSPANRGADFYRTSAADVWKLRDYSVHHVEPVRGGEQMSVTYEANGKQHSDVFEARWLHAFAPFVGKALHSGHVACAPLKGTGSMLGALHRRRTPWTKDVTMPKFDAKTLAESVDAQVEFLEGMVDPGIALITGVGTPERLEREFAGKPIEDLVYKIVGKFNQHPVRSTTYGVMRKTAESAKQGADYDMTNPLSMHTDHSVYQGTPGYLQFLYQAEGSVRSKVCDGLALAEYVREHHPEAYKFLTTVDMTHSSRNTLYTREGAPRSVYDQSTTSAPFELVHTHPIIQLDEDGHVEKVVQSETKRGVCALPYEVYEPFMEAYELWTQLCEDERFIKHFDWPEGTCVVTNNYRTLHGRASVPLGMNRTMTFGYLNKILVENRYRLLKQFQTERVEPSMDHRWLTRVPNQVLEKLTSAAVA